MNRFTTVRRGHKVSAVAVAAAILAGGSIAYGAPAQAAPVYGIEGEWQSPVPVTATAGQTLDSRWRYNVNDGDAAPGNEPVANVTLSFIAEHGRFTSLPGVCLTDDVTPGSSISSDGSTLVCNVGTRSQGTAELMLTGLVVDGMTGDAVTVSAVLDDAEATLSAIPIANAFRMDMKFDGGAPSNARDGLTQQVAFPWSLRHAVGAAPGPDAVSYDLAFTSTANDALVPHVSGCTAQNGTHPGHPHSGIAGPAAETAPFAASCTLTLTGPNTMRLTVQGIDYSKTLRPTLDSTGMPLESGWDVVAAGLITVQFTYASTTTITFRSTAPTYVSRDGETSADDPANNSNRVVSTRGVWTGGWALDMLSPPSAGARWIDTFRAMASQPVHAVGGVRPPLPGDSNPSQTCVVLDSRYVDFVDAALGTISNGVVTPYAGIQYLYFTGNGTANNMNPSHANYNPNTFSCAGTTGWTTVRPADLGTVRAVKAIISPAAGATIPEAVPRFHVDSVLQSDVAVGTDVWTWTSFMLPDDVAWQDGDRSLNTAELTAAGVLTPGSRYPYSGPGRDVLRIVAATPHLTNTVAQQETIPGATANYTLTYRAAAPRDMPIDTVTIVDTLPPGMTYIPGSAVPAPTSVTGQTLRWTLNAVPSNTDDVITFSARVPAGAEPGAVLTNQATATIAGQTVTATSTSRIRDGGYTMLTKTAAESTVPHLDGVAEAAWTLRVTSEDSRAQAFTDVVDVLPYNGDGRGTSFSGDYSLRAPVAAVPGATVYYTAVDPTTVSEDPADTSNGSAGDVTGNTVGWSTTFTADATAVRVIGPSLSPSTSQEIVVAVVTTGAEYEDVYVNRAEARADRTALVMRTSSRFEIGAVNSVALKKFVQDADGTWRDANDVDDYPAFHTGASVKYRLVVTNTGDQALHDLVVTDDMIDLAGLDPLPTGLAAGGVISEILPGAGNAVTIEYDAPLASAPAGSLVVNTACVAPRDATPVPGEPEPVTESCESAGVEVLPSSLSWQKVSAGSAVRLESSEWELTRVGADDQPIGAPIEIVDCVAAAGSDCDGADVDPAPGAFTVAPLDDARYRLVETRAPAGYRLDPTPRFIVVEGETSFEEPIENELSPVPAIPLTGGVGSFSFLITAAALGAAGLAGLFWQRRRRVRP